MWGQRCCGVNVVGSSLPLAFIQFLAYFLLVFPNVLVLFDTQFHALNRTADRAVVVYPEVFPHLGQRSPTQEADQLDGHIPRQVLHASAGYAELLPRHPEMRTNTGYNLFDAWAKDPGFRYLFLSESPEYSMRNGHNIISFDNMFLNVSQKKT